MTDLHTRTTKKITLFGRECTVYKMGTHSFIRKGKMFVSVVDARAGDAKWKKAKKSCTRRKLANKGVTIRKLSARKSAKVKVKKGGAARSSSARKSIKKSIKKSLKLKRKSLKVKRKSPKVSARKTIRRVLGFTASFL